MAALGLRGPTDISWQASGIIFISAGVFWIAFVLVYRLFFHPLASQPGPFLAKFTSWYAAYHSYVGDITLDIARCHEIYGDVVRYRPNGLLFNNIEGVQDIYSNPFKTKKSQGYHTFQREESSASIISAIDKDEHAPRRRLLSRAFSMAALQKYEPLVSSTAKTFCDSVLGLLDGRREKSQWGPPRDIGHLSSFFTFDVMSKVIFYTPQDLLTKPDNRDLIKEIDSIMLLIGTAMEQPSLNDFPFLKLLFFRKQVKHGVAFSERAKAFVQNRIALGKEQEVNDIFGNLLSDGKGLQGLSLAELAADAGVMIVAGTDTSSVAISSFFFYLARNPEMYAKLATEIRSTFNNAEEIRSGPKLTGCTYLRACIDESMRLSPSVGAPLWREMKDKEIIAGVALPKGTEVGTCIASIQRHPEYFPEPNKFIPERWLPGFQDEKQTELSKRAFLPFSLGARGCIGKNLAYIELTTVLAQIMYRSDWQLADGPLGKIGEAHTKYGIDFELKAHFTSAKEGPFIQFKSRDA